MRFPNPEVATTKRGGRRRVSSPIEPKPSAPGSLTSHPRTLARRQAQASQGPQEEERRSRRGRRSRESPGDALHEVSTAKTENTDLTHSSLSFPFFLVTPRRETSSRYEHSFSRTDYRDTAERKERGECQLTFFFPPHSRSLPHQQQQQPRSITDRQAKQKAEAAKLKEMQAKAAKGGPLLGGGKPTPSFLLLAMTRSQIQSAHP